MHGADTARSMRHVEPLRDRPGSRRRPQVQGEERDAIRTQSGVQVLPDARLWCYEMASSLGAWWNGLTAHDEWFCSCKLLNRNGFPLGNRSNEQFSNSAAGLSSLCFNSCTGIVTRYNARPSGVT